MSRENRSEESKLSEAQVKEKEQYQKSVKASENKNYDEDDDDDDIVIIKEINAELFKEKILQDIRYAVALASAKDILQEKRRYVHTAEAGRIRKRYRKTNLIRGIAMFVYLALPLFERPGWCRFDDRWDHDCITRSDGAQAPNSNLPKLNNYVFLALSWIALTTLTSTKWVKMHYVMRRDKGYFSKENQIAALTVLIYIFDIIELFLSSNFPISSLIRPVYFAIYFRTMRKTIRLYVNIVWRSRYLLLMMFVNFMLFASSAKILFYQTAQNQPTYNHAYFETFWDTCYNLFVCQTTCNYPDIMYPIFAEYRSAFFFFGLFMISNYFLLYNMIIAIFYFNFKEIIHADMEQIVKKYRMIDIVNEMIIMKDERTETLGQELIDKRIIDKPEDIQAVKDQMRRKKEKELRIVMEVHERGRGLLNFIYSPVYEFLMAFISFAAFVILVWQSSVIAPEPGQVFTEFDEKADWTCIVVETILTLVLLLNACLKFYALGLRNATQSHFLIFELITTVSGFIFLILYILDLVPRSHYWIHYAVLPRAVRVIRYIARREKFGIIIDTFYKLVPFFRNLAGVLLCVFYFFTVLGMTLYGGKFNTAQPVDWKQLGITSDYIYDNFNDFGQGLITCFHLLVVNNWLNTVALVVEIEQSRTHRWFFVLFYIIGVLISYNIMIAFIIDMFVSQLSEKQGEIFEGHFTEHEEVQRPKNLKVSRLGSLIVEEVASDAMSNYKAPEESLDVKDFLNKEDITKPLI